ncbi:hypothetical protein [Actimicrobium antarcticum]|uniref:Transposase n=1 Tax=Actimicrobium antarcticum TaxID=1051899 RepID=A0ABP7SZX8_9BURK
MNDVFEVYVSWSNLYGHLSYQQRIRALERENRELRPDVSILEKASAFVALELK